MPKDLFFSLKEAKKKKIINAGVKEFSRAGLENASIKNIVEEAGVARGSFYAYFEDKEDFLLYLLEKVKTDIENIHLKTFKDATNIFDFLKKEFIERLNYVEKCNNEDCKPLPMKLFHTLSKTKSDREFLVKNFNRDNFLDDSKALRGYLENGSSKNVARIIEA
jgi:AcrR family transcriptional regulator